MLLSGTSGIPCLERETKQTATWNWAKNSGLAGPGHPEINCISAGLPETSLLFLHFKSYLHHCLIYFHIMNNKS